MRKNENLVKLNFGGSELKKRTEVKDLGLIINNTLNWAAHVMKRISKALGSLFLLTRNTSSSTSKEA